MSVSRLPASTVSRDRILAAAQSLFGQHGPGEVTMAEVADAAGVARATVFNQFGSKHALIEAVTGTVFEGYEGILQNALEARKTPVPVLVCALFELMGRGIESERRFYRMVFREIARVNLGLEEGGVAQRARSRALDSLVHLLTRGQARGELLATFDVEELAVAFDSLVFGTISHWLYDDSTESLEPRMRRAAEIFLGPVSSEVVNEYDGPVPDLRTESVATKGEVA